MRYSINIHVLISGKATGYWVAILNDNKPPRAGIGTRPPCLTGRRAIDELQSRVDEGDENAGLALRSMNLLEYEGELASLKRDCAQRLA
jgi:hypothetical protein